MDVDVILVDDEPDNFRALEAILRKAKPLTWEGETLTPRIHKVLARTAADRAFDLEATIGEVRGFNPGVAIVDMRLAGHDPEDCSGVELSLNIKSMYNDCCIILISSFFDETASVRLFAHHEVFRHRVDRGSSAEDYEKELLDRFEEAVLTHVTSLVTTHEYRRIQFATTENGGRRQMWGLVLEPRKKGITVRRDLPIPYLRGNSVMVKLIEVGVCGTDRRSLGLDRAPAYELVDFHEAFGEVVWTGEGVRGLRRGDLVVPMVRRCETWNEPKRGGKIGRASFIFHPCDDVTQKDCSRQPDRCPAGVFTGVVNGRRVGYRSRGTGKCHGFGSQYFLDTEDWLVRVDPPRESDPELRDKMMKRYVLAEPMSIVWKMRREILRHYAIREFRDNLLIIGVGPIGLLAATVMKKLHPGVALTAVDLADETNRRVELLNKHLPGFAFFHAKEPDEAPTGLRERKFQIIIEATDQPGSVFKYAPGLLAPGGILVLLGISGGKRAVRINPNAFSEFVRRGNTLIGSINSSRADFEDSIAFMQNVVGKDDSVLDDMVERWPIDDNLSQKLLDRLGETKAWKRPEIKVVLEAKTVP